MTRFGVGEGLRPNPGTLRLAEPGSEPWARGEIASALARLLASADRRPRSLSELKDEARARLLRVLGEVAQAVALPNDFPPEEFDGHGGGVIASVAGPSGTQRRIRREDLERALEAVDRFEGSHEPSSEQTFHQMWTEVQAVLLERLGFTRPFPFTGLLHGRIEAYSTAELASEYSLAIRGRAGVKGGASHHEADPIMPARDQRPSGAGDIEAELAALGYDESLKPEDTLFLDPKVRELYAGQILAVHGSTILAHGSERTAVREAAARVTPPPGEFKLLFMPPADPPTPDESSSSD